MLNITTYTYTAYNYIYLFTDIQIKLHIHTIYPPHIYLHASIHTSILYIIILTICNY